MKVLFLDILPDGNGLSGLFILSISKSKKSLITFPEAEIKKTAKIGKIQKLTGSFARNKPTIRPKTDNKQILGLISFI